ncbi:Alpha,alpha-trehalose-phosphate synthase [UDP-forming] [Granulibacter bethesdensis]|uniref:alpha,alpha-trehalose-phosphate synthase (UDP-forming) n=1 Tax=Granulibacter bethesdensis TaxID=364410 RepID=UPI00090C13E7|nr:trehalose-6-phosphate synthase [Granulibacter bethesdensis]APH56558.1 Alpha,alpha-trehalose-phosphate synthase [UDP-forming] [Granulibacter bethesdensis]
MSRLVVISNRVPLPGNDSLAGGLAVALSGLLQSKGGLWFGWSGRINDEGDDTIHHQADGEVDYATIDLRRHEHDGFYNRFANGTLWPLLHGMPDLVRFRQQDATTYRAVNQRFADLVSTLLKPDDFIWIHDYHFLPLASMLRQKGLRNPIGFFLHIPFCMHETLQTVPGMDGLVREMLQADLVGFQSTSDMEHFSQAAHQAGLVKGLPPTLETMQGHRVRLGVFPAAIDARGFAQTASTAMEGPEYHALQKSLGTQSLILGVDRLDPTKGLRQKIGAYRQFLLRHPEWRELTSLLQIAAASRQEVETYRRLKEDVTREAGAINAEMGTPHWQPLRLVTQAGRRDVIAGYMRLAKVALVTPARDGMNLVAKEFIAAQRAEDPGVLILSRFAGAADHLQEALIVNPHDHDSLAETIARALSMPLPERRARWEALWHRLQQEDPVKWGQSFIASLMRSTHHPAPPISMSRLPHPHAPIIRTGSRSVSVQEHGASKNMSHH